eukprot:TRINITY_DN8218_c0_g1_i1.p1 TRINITY_DN8218_c0_g1~~TRINITY_DN8218_c0_g1_i1.p1  ORF type:complete len:539 (+),score=88.72 TRINITY_DN8218_c0_g1_i1:104-1720(+)
MLLPRRKLLRWLIVATLIIAAAYVTGLVAMGAELQQIPAKTPGRYQSTRSTTTRSIAKGFGEQLPLRQQPPLTAYRQPHRWEDGKDLLNKPCFQGYGYWCVYKPGPINPQCCCLVDEDGKPLDSHRDEYKALMSAQPRKEIQLPMACMPSYAIIGAQKAGTTAMATYMLYHPNITPFGRKEGHLFDKLDLLTDGISPSRLKVYMRRLPQLQGPQLHKTLVGDATPAYVLSPRYAKIMHSSLPRLRLIMILRNPVTRAYSEYQMKVRRVEHQNMVDRPDYQRKIQATMAECSKTDQSMSAVIACFRARVRSDLEAFSMLAFGRRNLRSYNRCLSTGSNDRQALVERSTSCLRDLRRETVEPFDVEARGEMEMIDDSMRLVSPHVHCAIREQCLRNVSLANQMEFDALQHWPQGSNSNIVRDFIWRGLYLEQIKWYHRQYGKEALLIVTDTDLKQHTLATMDRVFHHIGVLPIQVDLSTVTSDVLEDLRESIWPSFDTSGWQMKSEYPPMDEEFRRELAAFYAPHNRRLELYLNRSFDWD